MNYFNIQFAHFSYFITIFQPNLDHIVQELRSSGSVDTKIGQIVYMYLRLIFFAGRKVSIKLDIYVLETSRYREWDQNFR